MMAVVIVSTMTNCESSASVMSMVKKRIDQSGETGIFVTASGYAMNARPKPAEKHKKRIAKGANIWVH